MTVGRMIPDEEEEEKPVITRHLTMRTNPDGSQLIHRHSQELYPPPKPQPETEDRQRFPRHQLATRDGGPNSGAEFARQRAAGVKRDLQRVKTVQDANRAFWDKK